MIKILLLIACVWIVSDYGILISWFLAVPVLVILVDYQVFARFLRHHPEPGSSRPVTVPEAVRSISGDYVGSMLAEIGVRLLPLMVLSYLGESQTAYYSQAWAVATPLFLVATNMASAFTVEASADMEQILHNSRRILKQMARLLSLAVAGIWIFAPLILRVFGASYAHEGTALLRWLVLASLPLGFNVWYLSYSRVLSHVKDIIIVQGLTTAVTLAVVTIWLPSQGLVTVGWAWLAAQMVVALYVFIRTYRLFTYRESQAVITEKPLLRNDLRRVDWRFLLSNPRAQKSVCFSDSLLARAAAAVSDHTVLPDSPSCTGCDLAVAENPGRVMVKKAFAALQAGGAFYSEWPAWRSGGARGILRRLESAGFKNIHLYWIIPSLEKPSLWVPLHQEQPAAGAYIAQWLFPTGILFHRLARPAFRLAFRLAVWTGLVPGVSAIAWKDKPPQLDVMNIIQDEWASRHAGQPTCLMQTSGNMSISKIIFLVFDGGSAQPAWVVKNPRLAEDAAALHKEQLLLNGLQEINRRSDHWLLLPQPVFFRDCSGISLFGEKALAGVPLTRLLSYSNLREYALRLTDYQSILARHSQKIPHSGSARNILDCLVDELHEQLEGDYLTQSEFRRLEKLLTRLGDIPTVIAHQDFTIWNVLECTQGLGCIDWTDAERDSFPLHDLVYGLASAAFVLERAWDDPQRACQVYRGLLGESTSSGAVFHECLARYAGQVGLRREQIAPLRAFAWALYTTIDIRLRTVEAGQPLATKNSMYLSLLKTELAFLETSSDDPSPLP